MSEEAKIPPPKNPLTIKLNLTILRFVRDLFFRKWLPSLDPFVTSDLRTADHNAKVGGVPNSAHVHGLAEDFQLRYKNGEVLSEAQAKVIFDQFVKPNWPGYSEWDPSGPGEGYHVHVQLSREISTYAGLISLAGMGVLGFAIINNWEREKG